jgi:hypothetical protein
LDVAIPAQQDNSLAVSPPATRRFQVRVSVVVVCVIANEEHLRVFPYLTCFAKTSRKEHLPSRVIACSMDGSKLELKKALYFWLY